MVINLPSYDGRSGVCCNLTKCSRVCTQCPARELLGPFVFKLYKKFSAFNSKHPTNHDSSIFSTTKVTFIFFLVLFYRFLFFFYFNFFLRQSHLQGEKGFSLFLTNVQSSFILGLRLTCLVDFLAIVIHFCAISHLVHDHELKVFSFSSS